MLKEQLKLYAVTDRAWLNGNTLESVVEEILAGGATILQLREKMLPYEEFLAEARRIKVICDRYKVPLIINDEVEIARELGVGAHVGQHDLKLQQARQMLGADAVIGVSCKNVAEALEAEAAGADYVPPQELAAICAAVKIPVVAIGGISHANVEQLAGSGIAGVAVVSALFAAENPRKATAEMLKQLDFVR